MSTYTLSYIVGKEGSNEVSLNAIEPICESTLQADKKYIDAHHDSFKLIQCVQINIQELLDVVEKHEMEFFETRSMQEAEIDNISLNVSRLMLNILSMFRSFLDHSDVSISREFGKDSKELKLWKSTLSREYDASFEYRFLYKLRNYAQHIGTPPISLSFIDKGSVGTFFEMTISKEQLLKEKKLWGKQVEADLESYHGEIHLLETLERWADSYKNIAEVLLGIKREVALDSAKRISSYKSKYNLPMKSRLCAIRVPDSLDDPNRLDLTLDWLPIDKADLITEGNPFESI